MAKNYDLKVKQWITVNGKHIPIFEGQTKSDVVNRIRNKKESGDKTQITESDNSTDVQKQIAKDQDEKDRQIAQNKVDAKTAKANQSVQNQHKQAIEELNDPKYDDDTYDIVTKKTISFDNGYQVTFCQIGDDYSDDDYERKVNECLKLSSDKKTYAGKFGGTPEISFHCGGKEQALSYGYVNNQVSIWDWENCLTIKCGGTGIQPKEFGLTKSQYDDTLKFIHSDSKRETKFNDILDGDNYEENIKKFVKDMYKLSRR